MIYPNCSCGKNIPGSYNGKGPSNPTCPICNKYFSDRARDLWGTSYCENGHIWHTCLVCQEVVIGDSPGVLISEENPIALKKPTIEELELRIKRLEREVAWLKGISKS